MSRGVVQFDHVFESSQRRLRPSYHCGEWFLELLPHGDGGGEGT